MKVRVPRSQTRFEPREAQLEVMEFVGRIAFSLVLEGIGDGVDFKLLDAARPAVPNLVSAAEDEAGTARGALDRALYGFAGLSRISQFFQGIRRIHDFSLTWIL
jgi:hypothetical protein